MVLQGLSGRLRAARAAADLTQGAVASVLGYVPATVANWERGRTEPGASDLARLAVLYHVSVDWILTGTPRMPHSFERCERCEHDIPITDRCTACEVPK
jgi:transcriptional regulator with XRE-family HTH domain